MCTGVSAWGLVVEKRVSKFFFEFFVQKNIDLVSVSVTFCCLFM